MPDGYLTQATLDRLAELEIRSDLEEEEDEEEEIEVIYVESLTGPEIVDFARYGELQIIEELERLGLLHKLKEATDARGNTALHMASANGHIDVVNFILRVIGDDKDYINRLNAELNTALHWACLNGHLEISKALLQSGADHTVHLKNSADRLAFDEALQQNHESIMTAIADFTSSTSETATTELS